ncbi:lysoplasmalogenase [Amycolatopsis rhizosphaerae]|uniref:lysoplasmalogenase n=1 Tax=Amycolatopsis rhizosphaerae TaxID=2053003 RepID=UPI001FE66A6D|nr:lysoplasmalogenase [Amycolatopsis rhizosphaerae]
MRAKYALVAVADTTLALLGASRWRKITKPVLMPVLAAENRPAGPAATLGLLGSWAGDVALLRGGDRAFLTGLGSFLAAHVAYTGAFAARGGRPRARLVVPVAVTTAATAAVIGRKAGPLRRPVQVYALAIGTMGATATTVRGPGAGRIVAGAAAFMASDSLLALGRFVLPKRWARVTDAGVMASYTLAQWLIHDGLRRYDANAPQ